MGAHFEADDAFGNGLAVDRADRQGSNSDEEELNGGNSSSQSEDEDELLSASALSAASAQSGGSKTAGNSRKAANLDSSASSRPPPSSRPNGLASKTTSMPAGPFAAVNRIDEAFARRTVLRQGLEGRTRTVAVVTPALPSRRVANASLVLARLCSLGELVGLLIELTAALHNLRHNRQMHRHDFPHIAMSSARHQRPTDLEGHDGIVSLCHTPAGIIQAHHTLTLIDTGQQGGSPFRTSSGSPPPRLRPVQRQNSSHFPLITPSRFLVPVVLYSFGLPLLDPVSC
ncbi:hypothetical protein V8E36_009804 [Tilletia maclaganii]